MLKDYPENNTGWNHMNKTMAKDGIWRINSLVHVHSVILLLRTEDFTKKKILHGGVQAKMCGIRERFGIPKLRSAVKSIIYNCNLCKTFCKGRLKPSATVNFLIFPSELDVLSQTIRIDFTVPLIYKQWDQKIKGYIVILTCPTLRAVHLKCPNQC